MNSPLSRTSLDLFDDFCGDERLLISLDLSRFRRSLATNNVISFQARNAPYSSSLVDEYVLRTLPYPSGFPAYE
jgi:hypothetical protein